jgi:tetratricopeptide (TPR) repeat protein
VTSFAPRSAGAYVVVLSLLAATSLHAQPGNPDSVRALMERARQHSARGETAAAIEALRRARILAPNSEDVLSAFAQVSLAARAPLPAIGALQPLARMCPTVGQYRYLLGVAFMQAGAMAEAVESLGGAETLEPNRVLTLVALGLALNDRQRYAEAATYLRRGLEVEPGNIEALAALAEAEEGMDDLAQADAHARRVLAGAADHAVANLVIGRVLMKQRRYAEARDALLKAAAADPDSSRAEYQLSLAYARLGDEASSQKHLELYRLKLRETEERLKKLRGEVPQ